MEKDSSILNIVNEIRAIKQFIELEIVDYWEADLCAIGIKKGKKLVYISTYNYVDSNIEMYDYDFELIGGFENIRIEVVKQRRSVAKEEFISELKDFFKD